MMKEKTVVANSDEERNCEQKSVVVDRSNSCKASWRFGL